MSSKYYLLLIPLFFVQMDCLADPISKAIKALNKGKHQQVETILNKSLVKHPINPGARYAFSLLYFDSTYANRNLDSAHWFIEQALIDEQQPDSLEGLPLVKADLTVDHLLAHKLEVDRAAYAVAVDQNTVESFQYFIDEYNNAPQYANAISRRDLLAFEIASAEHTYDSYKRFYEQYPEADHAPVARERYETLVFQSKTDSGKLEQYVQFLQEHPNTPYRNQAEWQVFQLSTLDHHASSYRDFKSEYPESKYVTVANNILYHLDKDQFINENHISDSLRQIHQLESIPLIPIFEDGRYGFIDRNGNYQIKASFDSIPENYLCQLLTEDVFQAFVNQKLVLMGRNQEILWDQAFDGITDLGRGLLKINIGEKHGILHKSGWVVLAIEYDQIELLGNSFLAVNKNGKWGVSSMTGRIISKPQFESLQSEGAFFLFEKGDWAVSNKEQLIHSFELSKDFSYLYDDWDIVSSDYLMVFSDGKEGIVNKKLLPVIPLSEHEIHELDSADWYVKTAHETIRFYGESLQAIPPDRYRDFVSNEHFICLMRDTEWEVWDRSTLDRINQIDYGSAARLGTHLILLEDATGSSVLFKNGSLLKLANNDKLKLIRDAAQSTGFLQISGNGGKRQIYDLEGKPVYHTWYYDVNPLTPETFIIEKNGIKGIVNLEGKVLLKPRYKTLVADSATHISLLHNGKFGYFNPLNGSLIRPQYESRLVYFDKNSLLTSKNGKKGLVNHKNKVLLPFEYEQIRTWSDSLVIASRDNRWSVLNYHTGEVHFDEITGLEWISDGDRHKLVVKTGAGYGLLDNYQGMLLNPGFNDIINLGTEKEPVFFTEKYIPEADYFVVIYYNQDMDVIRKQVFDSGNYDQVYCF